MTSDNPIKARKSAALHTIAVPLVLALIPLLHACASNGVQSTRASACTVTDSLVRRNGTPGVQLVNECGQCMAVAFEFRNRGENNQYTACYVPENSRVVFWDAEEYWLISRKPCDDVKQHGLGGVSNAQIEHNRQIGRCDNLGQYAQQTFQTAK